MYYVYQVANNKNQKLYIGQTTNLDRRIRAHFSDNRTYNQYFKKALIEIGKDNFTFSILKECKTRQEALSYEAYYIIKLNTLYPNGYNQTLSKINGDYAISSNSKQVCVFNLKGRYITTYQTIEMASSKLGINQSDISAVCRKRVGRAGKYQFSYIEDRENVENKPYVRPKSVRRKKVYQYDRQGNYINEYDSLESASKLTGTRRTCISICLDKYGTANNFIWTTKKYDKVKPYYIDYGKHIKQYDENWNYIATYPNCIACAYAIGKDKKCYKTINKYLDKNIKVYGYYWKRAK